MGFSRTVARTLFLAAAIVMPSVARAADPLEASLSFQPGTIPAGVTSVMLLEITNPNAIAATGLAASDFYPSGIFNASPASATSSIRRCPYPLATPHSPPSLPASRWGMRPFPSVCAYPTSARLLRTAALS